LKWDGDTALQFRRDVLKPFFDQYLKAGAPTQRPRRYSSTTPGESLGSTAELAAGLRERLRRTDEGTLPSGRFRPRLRQAGDRQRFRQLRFGPREARPLSAAPVRFADGDRWKQWLVTDQRSVADRTDV